MFLQAWPGGWLPWWFFPPLMMLGMGLMMWLMMRGMGGHGHGSEHADSRSPSRTARSILDERYAGGELTREQYQQMRADLEG